MYTDRSPQLKLLKAALGEIEALRMKRQRQYADQPHPSLKRFTQEELNDEVCPTYKNLLIGRSNRLPDRHTLINIADYLECTSDERNDLLVAAGYLPLDSPLEGRTLELALEQAHQLMTHLPFPAMVVNYTLDIKDSNEAFRRLFEISLDFFYENPMNLFDFHFNSELPIRSRSSFDTASLEQWKSHAIHGINAFKRNHLLSRYDAWYQNLTQKIHQYADADQIWKMEPKYQEFQENSSRTILARTESSGELVPIRYKQIYISAGSSMYPRIGVFLPVDKPARKAFEYLGCPAEYSHIFSVSTPHQTG